MARNRVYVPTGLVNLESIADSIQQAADRGLPVVLELAAEPAEATRRLMDTLGVRIEVKPVTALVAELCVETLCTDEPLPGLAHCRRHASIGEIRIARENGLSNGLAALEAMDRGEPQPASVSRPSIEVAKPEVDTPSDTGTRQKPATPHVEPKREDTGTDTRRRCKTPGCTNLANTRYSRGTLAGLCVERCIDIRREQSSAAAKAVHARLKGDPVSGRGPVKPRTAVEPTSEKAPAEATPTPVPAAETATAIAELAPRPEETPTVSPLPTSVIVNRAALAAEAERLDDLSVQAAMARDAITTFLENIEAITL